MAISTSFDFFSLVNTVACDFIIVSMEVLLKHHEASFHLGIFLVRLHNHGRKAQVNSAPKTSNP